jgi:hypothetical protein
LVLQFYILGVVVVLFLAISFGMSLGSIARANTKYKFDSLLDDIKVRIGRDRIQEGRTRGERKGVRER